MKLRLALGSGPRSWLLLEQILLGQRLRLRLALGQGLGPWLVLAPAIQPSGVGLKRYSR